MNHFKFKVGDTVQHIATKNITHSTGKVIHIIGIGWVQVKWKENDIAVHPSHNLVLVQKKNHPSTDIFK